MSKKVIDFDEAWKEQDKSPVIARMFGREWELYPALLAEVSLSIVRLEAETGPDKNVDSAQMAMLMSKIVPPEVLAEWIALGLTDEQYGDVIKRLMALYQGAVAEEAEGESEAPETGATTSA